ncbi:ATP-dependent DNA helicase RecG [Candidatus Gracilibacteria bacterium]|nr:ATP-dependent DNA helicase RecG [Candidatus Gracilibacteria bacterium]
MIFTFHLVCLIHKDYYSIGIMLHTSLKNILSTTKTHLSKLEKLGILTVQDLLEFFPRAVENSEIKNNFSQIVLNEKNTISGELTSFHLEKTRFGKRIAKAECFLEDGTSINVVWFRIPYNLKNFEGSQQIFLVGKIIRNYGKIQIQNPEVHFEQNVHVGNIRPIYPESPPITSKWLREKISGILLFAKEFPEILPPDIISQESLLLKSEAIRKIHFPQTPEDWEKAKARLGFEEIFEIQLRVMQSKIFREKQKENLFPVPFSADQIKEDFKNLPFTLTLAQKKSLKDILFDLEKNRPMHRLLQGDVGAGKTIVAFLSALQVLRSGFQVAILAPTEILAKQHFESFLSFIEPFSKKNKKSLLGEQFPCELLTGSTKEKEKKNIKQRLKNDDIKVIIGTHAILTEDTVFKNLGLAVIDEQHRFGVKQRTILSQNLSHILSMTATPIPRSLALTIYGDQDLSIIDEKPAGRKDIVTRIIIDEKTRNLMTKFIDDQILKNRQIFWVCPLREESEKLDLRNVKNEFLHISQDLFPHRRVQFLHGKMKPKEKAEIMRQFQAHEFDILVSTSVIEVGVDIKNSTVMVIENSERFGLSQLHQFRGRIGRNNMQSYCFLMVDSPEQKTTERLRAMEKSNDGFHLSEVDLRLRGAGEIYGIKQSGIPDLKCADLNDLDTMKKARDWAQKILESDLYLKNFPALKQQIEQEEVYL